MEREQKQKVKFKVKFPSGVEYYCTPAETQAYLHSSSPDVDHIWRYTSNDPEAHAEGEPLFRRQITNFDEIVAYMRKTGYKIFDSTTGFPTTDDLIMYHKYLETLPLLEEPEYLELTPRQQGIVNFMGHLLLTEKLAIEDFNREGEIII